MKHDSFFAREAQIKNFEYLARSGVNVVEAFVVSDNCASQFKSRRPFAESTRLRVNITMLYTGEKHGKGMADGMFGRLKRCLDNLVKSGTCVIRNADDVFCALSRFYRTKANVNGGQINRREDPDLTCAVKDTMKLYSVRNTANPLELQVRRTPCTCIGCVERGICKNIPHVDEWKTVKLKPKYPNRMYLYEKRWPDSCHPVNDDVTDDGDDDEVIVEDDNPDETIIIDSSSDDQITTITEDFTDEESFSGNWTPMSSIHSDLHTTFDLIDDEDSVDQDIVWSSIRSYFFDCDTTKRLQQAVDHILDKGMRGLDERREVHFKEGSDVIDVNSKKIYPKDDPKGLTPVVTTGDGNCLTRALSRVYFGNEEHHEEVRVRLIIEAVKNKKQYLGSRDLNLGAEVCYGHAHMAQVWTQFSPYFNPGTKITDDLMEGLYDLDVMEMCKANSELGIFQLAQAANVFSSRIRCVVPDKGIGDHRNDFNRMFYPLDIQKRNHAGHFIGMSIMFTKARSGGSLTHFVALLPNVQ